MPVFQLRAPRQNAKMSPSADYDIYINSVPLSPQKLEITAGANCLQSKAILLYFAFRVIFRSAKLRGCVLNLNLGFRFVLNSTGSLLI